MSQELSPDEQTTFITSLAPILNDALKAYVPTMRLVLQYGQEGDEKMQKTLHGLGRVYGLELLGFSCLFDLTQDSWENHENSPISIMPLTMRLGESYSLLGLIDHPKSALKLPMASLAMIEEVYDFSAREWLTAWSEGNISELS